MKSITILNKIKKENACSIHTTELLTKALQRENKLDNNSAIRFRPLFCDFDIVNSDYLKHGATIIYDKPMNFETLYNKFN